MPERYFSNKDMSRCGMHKGFTMRDDGSLQLTKGAPLGVYVSRIYDSGRKETQWDRVMLRISGHAMIHVHVWLFDESPKEQDNSLECQFNDVQINAQYHSHYRQMLLFGHGEGRFARFAVEILPEEEKADILFESYWLTFPKESFTRYLPAIYRDNPELERFLAVHQSIYLEMEQKIDGIAGNLDYEYCGFEELVMLAMWMGWGELAQLLEWRKAADREILRKLLRTGTSLISRKGTCGYYREIVRILLDRRAVVIEEPDNRKAVVLILGKPEKGREKLLGWMERNVPIGMDVEFIVMQKTAVLDSQYFLDFTSYLSKYESELMEGGVDIDSLRLL